MAWRQQPRDSRGRFTKAVDSSVSVSFKTIAGKAFDFEVTIPNTFGELLAKIENGSGTPPDLVRFIGEEIAATSASGGAGGGGGGDGDDDEPDKPNDEQSPDDDDDDGEAEEDEGSDSEGGFAIFVKTPPGKTITLKVNVSDTIDTAKVLIHNKEGIPRREQRLLYKGEQLEGEKTLQFYDICAESTLQLAIVGRGGGGAERARGVENAVVALADIQLLPDDPPLVQKVFELDFEPMAFLQELVKERDHLGSYLHLLETQRGIVPENTVSADAYKQRLLPH